MVVGGTFTGYLGGADPTFRKLQILGGFGSIRHSVRVGTLVEPEWCKVESDIELLQLVTGLCNLVIPSVPIDPLFPIRIRWNHPMDRCWNLVQGRQAE